MEKFGSGINIPDQQHWLPFLILKVKIRKRTEPVFVNVYGAQESIRQAGNRFLGSLKGLQIRILDERSHL
jgi:hypothetical protein